MFQEHKRIILRHFWLSGSLHSFVCLSVGEQVTPRNLETEQLQLDIHSCLLKRVQLNIDEKQLHLSRTLNLLDDDAKTAIGPVSKSEVFTETSLQWNALELGVKAIDFELKCGDSDSCRASQRILFIMDLFERHFLERFGDWDGDGDPQFIAIFTNCLLDYNGIALLNDLEHIRDHEGIIPSINCKHGTDDGECIGEMMRKYRGNDTDDAVDSVFKSYMDGLHLRERNLLETASKIHSFVCHEIRDDEENIKQSQSVFGRGANELSSKFVNKVKTRVIQEKVEGKRMEDLDKSLQRNGFSDEECHRLMNVLFDQSYDSDTIVLDLVDEDSDPCNLYQDTNLFPMLCRKPFFAKVTKKHFGATRNDDEPLPSFQFGKEELYHTKHFEDRPGFVGEPKFTSLKDECLNNRICTMTYKQFSRFLLSAFTLRKTNKGRTLSAMQLYDHNRNFEVPVHSPLSVSHIFVLLMHCNLTDLQCKYKKFGCRESEVHKTFEDLKAWNREIAIWHRLLIEAVTFFGEMVRPKQIFYTGLDKKLSFETFAFDINTPISTTTSSDVTDRFCGANGSVLKLMAGSFTMDSYFNVEWLSDFAHEKERLFVQADNMTIADIQYFEGNILRRQNGHYIKAFTILSALFSGHYIFYHFSFLGHGRKKQRRYLSTLLDLICVYKANNRTANGLDQLSTISVPLYMQQLFHRLLSGIGSGDGKTWIIPSQFELLDEPLQRELISFPDTSSANRKPVVSTLLQNQCAAEKMIVMEEYVWIIDDKALSKLRITTGEPIQHSDPFMFSLSDSESIIFMLVLMRMNDEANATGVGVVTLETPFEVDLRWSVVCTEARWTLNEIIHLRTVDGEFRACIAFDSSFIDKEDMLTLRVALNFTRSKGKDV